MIDVPNIHFEAFIKAKLMATMDLRPTSKAGTYFVTPSLIGVDKAGHLPNASTFCGRCESVCPVRIPLPKMMRHWRERECERHLTPATVRSGNRLWGFFARRPALYRLATRLGMGALGLIGRSRGRFRWLPASRNWTKHRDFPAPQGETFQARWRRERGGRAA